MIEFLKTVDTPTLSNAIELLKLRPRSKNFAPLSIRCLFPELGRMCGYAVTAQVETVTRMEEFDPAPVIDLYDAIQASPKPAVIVFQEIGGLGDFATHCGEGMATVFIRLGAIGLVSDSGVRDVPEVRALKFHFFARGFVPSHANFRIASVGVPVQVISMEVRPGDLLHGDENGIIEIPREALPELPALVERVRTNERALMDFVRGPDFQLEELKRRLRNLK